MSNRAKALIGLWLYLTLCSVFMGVVLGTLLSRHWSTIVVSIGFASMCLAQLIALYLLALVRRTE
jgi:O-antigen/teichoic acid export membrane protein